jgi:hypothetical protein
MSADEIDLSELLTWEEGLPRPQWDLINAWVESRGDPDRKHDAWAAIGRSWLGHLAQALGGAYGTEESDQFLMLAPEPESAASLLRFGAHCKDGLLSVLGSVAEFTAPGKQVVVALRTAEEYYRYISIYYPEGNFGGSAGCHVRVGYPHLVLLGKQLSQLEDTLAHELTHAALHHLSMPLWVEEGLTQMFQHEATGRGLLVVDGEMARRHKRYWGRRGLDKFWRGEGFLHPGRVQELSYQLAEILARLLLEDARPRWFGWVQKPRQRYFAFLRGAAATDCGEAACQEHLGFGLSDLAARYLGAGSWSPTL